MEKELQAYGFFNEMENTHESTNLGKKRIVAVRDIATEALSVSLESLLISDIPIKLIHIVSGAFGRR